MFNGSIKNSSTLSFESWYTEKRIVNDDLELQIDIGSAQNGKSPKYLLVAHQPLARIGVPTKANNIAFFGNLDIRKDFVEIDRQSYLQDDVITLFSENGKLNQYRELKSLFRKHIGEEFLNPFINYVDMKSFYPVQIIDSKHQRDHITPEKIQLFEEYRKTLLMLEDS